LKPDGILPGASVEGVGDKAPPPPRYAFAIDDDTPDVALPGASLMGRLSALLGWAFAALVFVFLLYPYPGDHPAQPGFQRVSQAEGWCAAIVGVLFLVTRCRYYLLSRRGRG
jgi:hypothetical protein